jgi:hypothetical protein
LAQSAPRPAFQVLLRALRDFNLGKLTSDDTSIFMGLLNDLFPKTLELVPRAREVTFEAKVGAHVRCDGRCTITSARDEACGAWFDRAALPSEPRFAMLRWSWAISPMRPSASKSASCVSW